MGSQNGWSGDTRGFVLKLKPLCRKDLMPFLEIIFLSTSKFSPEYTALELATLELPATSVSGLPFLELEYDGFFPTSSPVIDLLLAILPAPFVSSL
jgi:hypothetical protein